jgi:hypothetical protein
VKWTIRVFKDELNGITRPFAVAERFGKSSAEDINPMRNLAFAGVVIANENHCFIVWGTRDVFHAN